MADVQIQQPDTSGGSGAGLVWALLVVVLLAVIGWLVLGGGLHRTNRTTIDVNVPGASAPTPAPSGGGATKQP